MKRILFVLCLFLVPASASASVLDQAERAMRDGQTDIAVTTLENYQPANQTEAMRRLWVMGVGYIRLGRPRAAIEPLNRLVAAVPDNPAYRLELALALRRAGQDERARYHLDLTKGIELDPRIEARVQAEIDDIDRSRNWQGYVRFALVPESNAAKRTAAETIDLGGLRFRLLPAAREKSATGAELGFGIAALPRLSDNLRARFGLDAFARVFDGDVPQDKILRGSAALLHFGDQGRQIAAEVFVTRRWLDDAVYSDSKGLDLRYARIFANKVNTIGTLTHERINYDRPAYKVDRTAASLQVVHATTAQLQLRAILRAETRDSRNRLAAGQAAGLSIGAQYIFEGGLRANLLLSQDYDRFDGIHPLFGVRRKDEKRSATLFLTNQNWSYRGFAPVLKLGIEEQKSTLVINSYRNMSVSVSLTRSF